MTRAHVTVFSSDIPRIVRPGFHARRQTVMEDLSANGRVPSGDASEKSYSYVFTTVRWDPLLATSPENTAASCNLACPFFLLEHQWTRLQIAKWTSSLRSASPAELLQALQDAVAKWLADHPDKEIESLRVRHAIHLDGSTATEIRPLARVPLQRLFPTSLSRPADLDKKSVSWEVLLDRDNPQTVSARTMYKTSDRSFYDKARANTGISSYDQNSEVLLINVENDIMDGSIATPYFFRNGQWVTPDAYSGGQQGTTRRWALEKGLCIEGNIPASSMRDGELIWLSNAARGFYVARYRSTNHVASREGCRQ